MNSQSTKVTSEPLLKDKAIRLAFLCNGISGQIGRTEDVATSLLRDENNEVASPSVEEDPQCLYSALSMVEGRLEAALFRLEKVNSKFSSLV